MYYNLRSYRYQLSKFSHTFSENLTSNAILGDDMCVAFKCCIDGAEPGRKNKVCHLNIKDNLMHNKFRGKKRSEDAYRSKSFQTGWSRKPSKSIWWLPITSVWNIFWSVSGSSCMRWVHYRAERSLVRAHGDPQIFKLQVLLFKQVGLHWVILAKVDWPWAIFKVL